MATGAHDYQIVSKDKQGNIQNVVINVANVPDSESLIVSILDVTEQHQARIQVQASEERFLTNDAEQRGFKSAMSIP